jgi:serine/threonine protein kinase
MEYFQRGTLDLYIKDTLTEDDSRSIAQQLFDGVRIMHEENFTHRDLKPQVGDIQRMMSEISH